MAQKLTATSLADKAHSKLFSVQNNFCLQPTENSLRYPGSRGFIFVLIANLCFEESTQNISPLLPANVFVPVFFSKEVEKMHVLGDKSDEELDIKILEYSNRAAFWG